MVSKEYDDKVLHEKRCLQLFLVNAGLRPPLNDQICDIRPYTQSIASISSFEEENEGKIDEALVDNLKLQNGITCEPQVDLEGSLTTKVYKTPATEAEKLKKLRANFITLMKRIMTDDDLREDFIDGESPEEVLKKVLRHLAEEPVQFVSGASELTYFRENLAVFLRLGIKSEAVEKASFRAESVDEVVYNLLHFPYDL